jgi:hypothetical protein
MSTTKEDMSVETLVKSALHQIRTRSLRDAPVYLQHVNYAENELVAALNKLRQHDLETGASIAATIINSTTGMVYH